MDVSNPVKPKQGVTNARDFHFKEFQETSGIKNVNVVPQIKHTHFSLVSFTQNGLLVSGNLENKVAWVKLGRNDKRIDKMTIAFHRHES